MSFQDVGVGSTPSQSRPRGGQDPSQGVAAGVFKMNTQVSKFKRLIQILGTAKDTPAHREKLHQMRQELTQTAKETGTKLKSAQAVDHTDVASKLRKISDAKLAKDFQSVLNDFQAAQKSAMEKETLFTPHSATSDGHEMINGEKLRLLHDQHPLTPEERRRESLVVENELVYNEAVIEERDAGIVEIQQQIGQVNEIFRDLAVLVKEQGHAIDDIESNIEASHADTQVANRHLAKAVKKQSWANSVTCWVMVVFGVALFILILVLFS